MHCGATALVSPDDRYCRDNDKAGAPPVPGTGEPEPEDAASLLEPWSPYFLPENVELLAKGQILHHEVGLGREDGPGNRDNGSGRSIGTS